MVPSEEEHSHKKVRGAWHNPVFTKVTSTIKEKRKAKKVERQNRKAGRK